MNASKRQTLAALIAAGLVTASSGALALGAGDPSPAFRLPGVDGEVSLADAKGQVVYLDFWASWCVPCRKSFPWMNEMQQKYGAKGLSIVAVNVDGKPDDARRFLADNPAQFRVAFDGKGDTPKLYAVKGMPSSVLIGPDGKVIAMHAGFRDEDRAVLETKIRDALAARQ